MPVVYLFCIRTRKIFQSVQLSFPVSGSLYTADLRFHKYLLKYRQTYAMHPVEISAHWLQTKTGNFHHSVRRRGHLFLALEDLDLLLNNGLSLPDVDLPHPPENKITPISIITSRCFESHDKFDFGFLGNRKRIFFNKNSAKLIKLSFTIFSLTNIYRLPRPTPLEGG